MRTILLWVGLAMMIAPSFAEARSRAYLNTVVPFKDGTFEVVGGNSVAARDYWCSAGDFVRLTLRKSAKQTIYLHTALGPSQAARGRKAVRFSLTPPEGADTSPGYSVSVKRVGDNMSAGAASQFCIGPMIDP